MQAYLEEVLPYERFSVRLPQCDIPRLHDILGSIPKPEVARLQVSFLICRHPVTALPCPQLASWKTWTVSSSGGPRPDAETLTEGLNDNTVSVDPETCCGWRHVECESGPGAAVAVFCALLPCSF